MRYIHCVRIVDAGLTPIITVLVIARFVRQMKRILFTLAGALYTSVKHDEMNGVRNR